MADDGLSDLRKINWKKCVRDILLPQPTYQDHHFTEVGNCQLV